MSEALALTDNGEDSPALDFQRAVFGILENHSLQDAIAGVFDPDHSEAGRSHVITGLTTRGAGVGGDRKDFADFTLRKLKHISTFFGCWETMSEKQRIEIKDEFSAAIVGDEYKLRGRPGDAHRVAVRFRAWPDDVCDVVMEAIKLRRKKKCFLR